MKKLRYFLTLSLLLAFAACSDSSEELVTSVDEVTETRTIITQTGASFYSYVDRSYYNVNFMDNLSSIYFHAADKDAVIAALEKKGVTAERRIIRDDPADYPIQQRKFNNPTEDINQFLDVIWATVRLSYQEALDIREVIDAEPYVTIEEDANTHFVCAPNVIAVFSGLGEQLEQTAKDTNTIILGRIDLPGIVLWEVARTRNSAGANSFETAKIFKEAGHRVSPTLIQGWPGGWCKEWELFEWDKDGNGIYY